MKHILPILTITTLAAAASAQTAAAPAGLSYNRVTVSREGQNNALAAEALLGSSNVIATIGTSTVYDNHGNPVASTSYSLGYVFKNVAFATDATVSVGSGNEASNSSVGLTLRRALGEVVQGLEARIVVGYNSGAGAAASTTDFTYELQYNINKQFGIAYSVTDLDVAGASNLHTVSLRYNF
jgi:hypothetical protein